MTVRNPPFIGSVFIILLCWFQADYVLGADANTVAPENWRNYGFGVALTYTQHLGNQVPVKNAQVVNGVVRVTEENNALPRVMLETHYFFKPKHDFLGSVPKNEWGWGPFIGVQPGSNNIPGLRELVWVVSSIFRGSGNSKLITTFTMLL